MIKLFDGDLLESGADIIAHQVNCQGKMNSGVAKQIREKYPKAFEEYVNLCGKYEDSSGLLGMAQPVIVDENTTVANLFTQNRYGYDGKQYTDVKALGKALSVLKYGKKSYEALLNKPVRVAIPWKIGCVRGGANWEEVYTMISEIFEDSEIELWRYDKG